MQFRVRKRREPQVVLVSLVDVVLQLVIFFVLTSTFNVGEVAMDISLPDLESPAGAVEEGITVELDGDGKISLDGREITRQELGDYFRSESKKAAGRVVLIRADRSASHGEVVAVMDLARAHDMRRLSIAAVTREREEDN